MTHIEIEEHQNVIDISSHHAIAASSAAAASSASGHRPAQLIRPGVQCKGLELCANACESEHRQGSVGAVVSKSSSVTDELMVVDPPCFLVLYNFQLRDCCPDRNPRLSRGSMRQARHHVHLRCSPCGVQRTQRSRQHSSRDQQCRQPPNSESQTINSRYGSKPRR